MSGSPDWISGDPSELRTWRNAQPDVVAPVLPDAVRIEPLAGGLVCYPEDPDTGAVLHFHGGGFVVGSPYTHRCVGACIAQTLRRPVWLCPWPLAPEHVLPQQSEAAAQSLRDAVDIFGSDIILSGDSAGALMALWAYSASNTVMRHSVSGALLLYGAFGQIPATGCETDGLGPNSVAAMYQKLDPNGLMAGCLELDPFAEGFPVPCNTIVIAAQDDPLAENSEKFCMRHANSKLLVAKGCGHGFLSAIQPSPDALEAVEGAARLILECGTQ
ncbi:alpha/beta hydrolase [Pseudoruegeria sp. HB172150]|uniref:alpha/beta hydrolase n=1 Tax=Pseudoruegeria sp. HB172150 TaxID=2721164 RepID=UPI0015532ADC|nr:alpha/beta hydrolase [Pseudoruegeria sp. HB172150]